MSDSSEKADELEERLVSLAGDIIKLSSQIPKSPEGKHVLSQVLRCGTSPAANYGESRGTESDADFIHKLSIVHKELNETAIWIWNDHQIRTGQIGCYREVA